MTNQLLLYLKYVMLIAKVTASLNFAKFTLKKPKHHQFAAFQFKKNPFRVLELDAQALHYYLTDIIYARTNGTVLKEPVLA